MDKFYKKIKYVLGIILIMSVALLIVVHSRTDRLKVYFFDVGQGDAILISTPAGENILIDGGPDRTILSKLGRALPFYERHLDYIIVTHPQADHFVGLIDVLDRYQVGKILTNGLSNNTPEFEAWEKMIDDHNVPVEQISSFQQMNLAGEVDTDLEILFPTRDMQLEQIDDFNNSSVVVKLEYGDSSFLFSGDAEKEEERQLLELDYDLDVDILKVGHHGSNSSSTQEFIDAVSPTVAIIQVGEDNRFGHPKIRVIRRLQRSGADIYRTDIDGDVIIASDGGNIEVLQ